VCRYIFQMSSRAVGVENGPSPLLLPVVYTTACTTVQAVMRLEKIPLYVCVFVHLKVLSNVLCIC